MKPSTFNFLFFIGGLVGLPICIYGWQRTHRSAWLIGIGVFVSFFISGLREILLRFRGR
jgi:hypothetical protein